MPTFPVLESVDDAVRRDSVGEDTLIGDVDRDRVHVAKVVIANARHRFDEQVRVVDRQRAAHFDVFHIEVVRPRRQAREHVDVVARETIGEILRRRLSDRGERDGPPRPQPLPAEFLP